MNYSAQKMLKERLAWVEPARLGILSAIGEDMVHPQFKVYPTVDPLKVMLKIILLHPLSNKTRKHLRDYIRCRAESHGCDVPIINIHDRNIYAEVLLKTRVWNRNEKGKFVKRRFVKKENR